jgi:hypothetical protein
LGVWDAPPARRERHPMSLYSVTMVVALRLRRRRSSHACRTVAEDKTIIRYGWRRKKKKKNMMQHARLKFGTYWLQAVCTYHYTKHIFLVWLKP